jgi:small subunit ribosomal protein S1
VTNDVSVLDEVTMEELMNESSTGQVGSVVTAVVVDATDQGVLVDVGLKVEGFIPLSEFRSLPNPPAPGESFPALIKRMDGPNGHPLVSWRQARERIHWDRIQQAKEAGTPVEGTVLRQVKGGLIVDIGLEGFLPASQADRRPMKDLSVLVGKKVRVEILEMDPKKGNVVVSRRHVLEGEAALLREQTLKDLDVGKIYTGTVTSVTDFGAFVDIGGIEGLLRISDVAWQRVEKLSDHVSVGQAIEVKVLKYDPATRKIALGRKHLLPFPWEGVETRYLVRNRVKGRVTHLTPFGAFVELEPGVEGLIHQSEFSWMERWPKPEKFVNPGDEVEVQVISCDAANQKIGLSLKRAGQNPWQEASALYPVGSRVKGTVTHLVAFGAFVRLPNGIEGLLRSADISWTKPVHHPKEFVSEGQELELVVLEVDAASERIALGLKQLREDPFVSVKPGDVVQAKVVRLTEFGAFAEIEADVEGFIHVAEIAADKRFGHASEALALGQEVTAVVTKLQRKSKRIDLSIRQQDQRQERHLLKQYQSPERVTLADVTEWEHEPTRS